MADTRTTDPDAVTAALLRAARGEEAVSDDPALYAVAESGWNRAFDVENRG
ncbi:hypothetical protein [Streptomyces sp. NPDC002276]